MTGEAVSVDPQLRTAVGVAFADVKNLGDTTAPATTLLFFEDVDGDGAYSPGTDTDLGSASTGPLVVGALERVSASVAGLLSFAGAPISAVVDAAGDVPESNEANNVGRSGSSCSFHPPEGVWAPELEWSWTGSPGLTPIDVASTPAVGDLDGDGVPDLTFVAIQFGQSSGRLVAISGRDGSPLFVSAPLLPIERRANPAIADIDGDGLPRW